MMRTFSFAAARLIALSSLAFAGTGSRSNGAYPQTHKHHSQSDHSASATSGNRYGTDAFRRDRIARSASEWRLLKAFPLGCVCTHSPYEDFYDWQS